MAAHICTLLIAGGEGREVGGCLNVHVWQGCHWLAKSLTCLWVTEPVGVGLPVIHTRAELTPSGFSAWVGWGEAGSGRGSSTDSHFKLTVVQMNTVRRIERNLSHGKV